jgi:hypothetical protein
MKIRLRSMSPFTSAITGPMSAITFCRRSTQPSGVSIETPPMRG